MTELFGTNGVRGIVNEDLTVEKALRLGKAIGRYLNGRIAVATDTRVTADLIKNAVCSGIMASGSSILDLGVVPTPALQYFVKKHSHLDGGVMITASHNPSEYNGVECIFSDGMEMNEGGEEKIKAYYEEDLPCCGVAKIGNLEHVSGAIESYIAAVLDRLDVSGIKRAGFKVVVDCGNGAASMTTPLLLKKLGVTAVTLNANPQGEFPGRPSEPTEANLKDLIALTKSSGADLGIAHDADGDRVIFVTSEGRFVTGDESLALMVKYIMSKRKGIFVTPVSTSMMVEEVVTSMGGTTTYTQVGSAYVSLKMREQSAVFGGEENGGMLFPEHQACRDAAMAIGRMFECIIENGPLQKQVEELPEYFIVKRDIECPNDKKEAVMKQVRTAHKNDNTNSTDGIKLLHYNGWVLIRPSGTEPLFRIFSDSKTEELAVKRADEAEAELRNLISTA